MDTVTDVAMSDQHSDLEWLAVDMSTNWEVVAEASYSLSQLVL